MILSAMISAQWVLWFWISLMFLIMAKKVISYKALPLLD